MLVSSQDLFAVLRRFNPWWTGAAIPGLPHWKRSAYAELSRWMLSPPAPRAVLLSGARQVGKTTLLRQLASELVDSGVPPSQILYLTFDQPLIKLAGLESALRTWREFHPPREGPEYLLLDEIQYSEGWQTWLKHEVDFNPLRRITVTGSSQPLRTERAESGIGRWHTIQLPTLSFREYLQIRNTPAPELPDLRSLAELRKWPAQRRIAVAEAARPLTAWFHEYLLRGGFPQAAMLEDIELSQKLTREDIVDRALRRDMTAFFGVRRVLELERLFLYLCLHDGGIVDVPTLASSLQVSAQSVNNFVDLLEASHLIYKLRPHGYGKEVLRGKYKVYLADPAIAGSVMLRGRDLLEDGRALGAAVEAAFFKHVFTSYYEVSIGFSFWRGKKEREVDIVASIGDQIVPFEVKYATSSVGRDDLRGLAEFCQQRRVERAYVITREMSAFDLVELGDTHVLAIPAPLACYWLGQPMQSGKE